MGPKLFAVLYDAGIPIAAGVYCTLLAHRVVGKKPGVDPKFDEYMITWGPRMKILGPALIVVSILGAALAAFRNA